MQMLDNQLSEVTHTNRKRRPLQCLVLLLDAKEKKGQKRQSDQLHMATPKADSKQHKASPLRCDWQSTLPCTRVVGRRGLLRFFFHTFDLFTLGVTRTHATGHSTGATPRGLLQCCRSHHSEACKCISCTGHSTGRKRVVVNRASQVIQTLDRLPTAPLQRMHCMHCKMPLAWKEEHKKVVQQRLCCHA